MAGVPPETRPVSGRAQTRTQVLEPWCPGLLCYIIARPSPSRAEDRAVCLPILPDRRRG